MLFYVIVNVIIFFLSEVLDLKLIIWCRYVVYYDGIQIQFYEYSEKTNHLGWPYS